MQGWGGSYRGGVGHEGVGWVMQGWGGLIGPISGIVLFEVVYINKWSTPQEAASWLHEPASMYEVIPSKPISTEEFTAKQLQWECMKAIQAVR